MTKVMVVEDNEFFKDMLSETLKAAGYVVVTADDGEEALNLLPQENPVIVITDIIMPKVTGISLIKQIRQKYPTIKMIAISGGWRGGMSDYLKTTQDEGVAYTFAKPIDMDELLAAVKKLAENSA